MSQENKNDEAVAEIHTSIRQPGLHKWHLRYDARILELRIHADIGKQALGASIAREVPTSDMEHRCEQVAYNVVSCNVVAESPFEHSAYYKAESLGSREVSSWTNERLHKVFFIGAHNVITTKNIGMNSMNYAAFAKSICNSLKSLIMPKVSQEQDALIFYKLDFVYKPTWKHGIF